MKWLRAAAAELAGLFVDDGRLALGILVWVVLAWGVLPHLLAPSWGAVVFAAGLGAILLESVLRRP